MQLTVKGKKRCINLLEKPDKGEIKVNGVNLSALSDKELRKERKKIGMIFQGFNEMRNVCVQNRVGVSLFDWLQMGPIAFPYDCQ